MNRQEAIQIIKKNWPNGRHMLSEALEFLIPELKESEDEKIRKELITWLQSIEGQSLPIDRHNAAIAWLEKQKKHSPLSKDEEYTLARIIEYLEDNGCPSKWKDLLYDVYALPYQKERKPAEWSEEDEEVFHCLEYTVKHYYDDKDTINKCCSWLKSIKERMKGK